MQRVCENGHHWPAEEAASTDVVATCPECGLPEQTIVLLDGELPPPPRAVPSAVKFAGGEPAGNARPNLRGYEIEGELGRGGMGVVYLARQSSLNRKVALKMILAGPRAGEQALARFRREAQAVAQLEHANIVRLYEVGEQDGLAYFALEYIEGGSLAHKLAQSPLPALEAARVVEILARAMHFAHQRGIIHRDLKPANVLLTSDGVPKITDLGLAKRLDEEDGQTHTGAVLGTPSYMAPEQAAGKSRQIGPAADVYSLGATLYEMLTGHPPFKAATSMETLRQVLHEEPVPVRRLQPGVPGSLETICLKCLEKEPGRRYASALDLADDVRRFLAHEPIRARPAGVLERLGKWVRRRPAAAALLAAGFLAILTSLALVGLLGYRSHSSGLERALDRADQERDQADRARAEAEQQRLLARRFQYLAQMHLAQRAWQEGDKARLQELLDAQVPGPNERDLRHFEWYHLRHVSSGSEATLAGHAKGICAMACSRDGKLLASGSFDATIKIWDLEQGKELFSLGDRAAYSLAFLADGKFLICADADKVVRIWDLTQRKEKAVVHRHTAALWALALSADERLLAIGSADGAIVVWDLAAEQELCTLSGHKRDVRALVFSPDGKRLYSAGHDQTLRTWDLGNQRELRSIRAHDDAIYALALSPDGRWLATGGVDTFVKIWHAETGKLDRTLANQAEVWVLAFDPSNRILASGSADRMLRLWNCQTGSELQKLRGHRDTVTTVAFRSGVRELVSASWDGTIKRWRNFEGQGIDRIAPEKVRARSIAFSPDGKFLASGNLDGSVKIWNSATLTLEREFTGHGKTFVEAVAWGPQGLLASADSAGTVIVQDEASGKVRHQIPARGVSDLAFSGEGQWLAGACVPGDIKLWHMDTGQLVHTFTGHDPQMPRVAFHPRAGRLAASCRDFTIKLWDIPANKELTTLSGHTQRVTCISFDSSGKRLASGGPDRTVRIWDAGTGKELLRLGGIRDIIHSVAFSPDGERLAAACGDNNTLIWDVPTGHLVATLPGSAPVLLVAFRPDGQCLVSSGAEHGLFFWHAPR